MYTHEAPRGHRLEAPRRRLAVREGGVRLVLSSIIMCGIINIMIISISISISIISIVSIITNIIMKRGERVLLTEIQLPRIARQGAVCQISTRG